MYLKFAFERKFPLEWPRRGPETHTWRPGPPARFDLGVRGPAARRLRAGAGSGATWRPSRDRQPRRLPGPVAPARQTRHSEPERDPTTPNARAHRCCPDPPEGPSAPQPNLALPGPTSAPQSALPDRASWRQQSWGVGDRADLGMVGFRAPRWLGGLLGEARRAGPARGTSSQLVRDSLSVISPECRSLKARRRACPTPQVLFSTVGALNF